MIIVVQLKRSEMEKERQGVDVQYAISKVSGISQTKAIVFRAGKRREIIFEGVMSLNSEPPGTGWERTQ